MGSVTITEDLRDIVTIIGSLCYYHQVRDLIGFVSVMGAVVIVDNLLLGRGSHMCCNYHRFCHHYQVEDLMGLVTTMGSVTIIRVNKDCGDIKCCSQNSSIPLVVLHLTNFSTLVISEQYIK